jgi:hypothetical protein
VLQTAYFDRLYEQCGQNVLLAAFYWFRSVELGADERSLVVHPVRPVSFAFLDAFSLAQTFALKALLDHLSLTPREYAAVAQVPLDEACGVFESFANVLLIEPVAEARVRGPLALDGVTPDRRYRLRSLVAHPVIEHLRARNIVH